MQAGANELLELGFFERLRPHVGRLDDDETEDLVLYRCRARKEGFGREPAELAFGLGLLADSSDPLAADAQVAVEEVAILDFGSQQGKKLAEKARVIAMLERPSSDRFDVAFELVGRALAGRDAVGAELLQARVEVAVGECDEVRLGRKMVDDHRAGDAALLGDARMAHLVEAVLGGELEEGFDDLELALVGLLLEELEDLAPVVSRKGLPLGVAHPWILQYPRAPVQRYTRGMETSLRIRAAESRDHSRISDIFRAVVRKGDTYVYPPDSTHEQALAIWLAPGNRVYVAEVDGRVEGTYYLRPNQIGLGAHVVNAGFMVAEDVFSRGIGSRMGEHAIAEARTLGFRAMQFNFVVSTNTRAVALWKRLGFQVVGTSPGAFNHAQLGYVDALIMHRSLV